MLSARSRLWPFILSLVLILSGCDHNQPPSGHRYQPPSDAERAASFAPFRAGSIQDQRADDFLRARTALLFSGSSLAAVRVDGSAIRLTFLDPRAGQTHHMFSLDVGHAAAIDSRGYFLTAAHTLSSSIVYMIYYSRGVPHLAIPRVVARDGDIALLHVPARPDAFTYSAADPAIGSAVLALGFTDLNALTPTLRVVSSVAMAGTVVPIPAYAQRMSLPAVAAQCPIRRGDSGTALVSPTGQLLGVICQAYNPYGNVTDAIALRPDPQWLASHIAQDQAAARADPSPPPFPQAAPRKDLPELLISPRRR